MQAKLTSLTKQAAPRSILLVCTQRIGDVLLTTPLARSLKKAWPDAALDMLVLPGTQSVLEGNTDIREVLAFAQRVSFAEKFRQLQRLWRRYDLALSPLPTDRARLFCWAAGRYRLGVLNTQSNETCKTLLLNQSIPFDDIDTHTVRMGLQLAERLGIAPCYQVVPPSLSAERHVALHRQLAVLVEHPYVVLHVYPKFTYKMWTPTGWLELARWLNGQGYAIVFTGGPDADECAYINTIANALSAPATRAPILNLAGKLSLAETADLLRSARLYIGPDTAVTHIAAACGTPTLALFGPSNPVKWGPWPNTWAHAQSPWQRQGSAHQGNVYLLQGQGDCVPCLYEGCARHVNSSSDCLTGLRIESVMQAATKLLSKHINT